MESRGEDLLPVPCENNFPRDGDPLNLVNTETIERIHIKQTHDNISGRIYTSTYKLSEISANKPHRTEYIGQGHLEGDALNPGYELQRGPGISCDLKILMRILSTQWISKWSEVSFVIKILSESMIWSCIRGYFQLLNVYLFYFSNQQASEQITNTNAPRLPGKNLKRFRIHPTPMFTPFFVFNVLKKSHAVENVTKICVELLIKTIFLVHCLIPFII